MATNQHQRFGKPDVIAGFFCLMFTVAVCAFDFEATGRASKVVAENVTKKPTRDKVDSDKHSTEIELAKSALAAEKEAERAERSAFNAGIDNTINSEASRLKSRLRQIAGKTWAENEVRQINSRLASLESERRSKKSAFIPQKTKVAELSSALASVQGRASQNLLNERIESDSLFSSGTKKYEENKDKTSNVIFWIYLFIMFLWHVCHGFKWYRALKYDEIHPDSGNPVAAIFESLKSGILNLIWGYRKKIAEWLPEDEVHGFVKEDMLFALQSELCKTVFGVICQNQGISEGAIYITLKTQDPMEVRQQLRWLKTARLCFENNGMWSADIQQAEKIPGFFLGRSDLHDDPDPVENFKENAEKSAENEGKSSIFEDESSEILAAIELLTSMLDFADAPDSENINLAIETLHSILDFYKK